MGDVHTVHIEPGDRVVKTFPISKTCQLRWKFRSEEGDLGFGIRIKESKEICEDEQDTSEEVIITERVPGSQSQGPTGWCATMPGWPGFYFVL